MVMEARALEARRVGPHEVRITKVYTVEAGHETGKHDVTPNYRERSVPVLTPGSFRLKIEAVAGRNIYEAGGSYRLIIKSACLTNPLAVFAPIVAVGASLDQSPLGLRGAVPIAEAFGVAAGWEYDGETDTYSKIWYIPFPQGLVNLYATTGGLMDALNQVDEVWQFFVILEDTTGGPVANDRVFTCTAASEPFLLISQRP